MVEGWGWDRKLFRKGPSDESILDKAKAGTDKKPTALSNNKQEVESDATGRYSTFTE